MNCPPPVRSACRLDIGESTKVQLELTATALGDFVHQACAFSEHAARTNARLETRVEGTASLVLEIADLDDPDNSGFSGVSAWASDDNSAARLWEVTQQMLAER